MYGCGSLPSPSSEPDGEAEKTDRELVVQEIGREENIRLDLETIVRINSMNVTEQERQIIVDFCQLLEKCKQYFNGLRDLPPYGHRQWQAYFGRTFDVYTKLWKYQQQHRQTLDAKYGLKRWQIGEIASKIGQLYYHFYLRTSDTGYLFEAYTFYRAIRGRAYYTQADKEDRSDLMVKKLRYYARFIVVSLLLRRMTLIRDLIRELDRQIVEYGLVYDPVDQREWAIVLKEAKSFLKADELLAVTYSNKVKMMISHRLEPRTTPQVDSSPNMSFSLADIVIIGSCLEQIKFSELTVDMYRMLQTLERNPPQEYYALFDGSPKARGLPPPIEEHASQNIIDGFRSNPHKYLLFMPTLSQVLVYLASGCKDLPPYGVLMIYLSGDGYFGPSPKSAEEAGYSAGGVLTGHKKEVRDPMASTKVREINCLYPGDLYPFTRWPLFIVIDSDNSIAFQNLQNFYSFPMVVLMSPVQLPSHLFDMQVYGNIFTLFLHSPLTAFSLCTDIPKLSAHEWESGQAIIDKFMVEATRLISKSRLDNIYMAFMNDEYLRLLILRYIFCDVVLRMHRGFYTRDHLPTAIPAMPEAELLANAGLHSIMRELVCMLDVRHHFRDESAPGKSTKDE